MATEQLKSVGNVDGDLFKLEELGKGVKCRIVKGKWGKRRKDIPILSEVTPISTNRPSLGLAERRQVVGREE